MLALETYLQMILPVQIWVVGNKGKSGEDVLGIDNDYFLPELSSRQL